VYGPRSPNRSDWFVVKCMAITASPVGLTVDVISVAQEVDGLACLSGLALIRPAVSVVALRFHGIVK